MESVSTNEIENILDTKKPLPVWADRERKSVHRYATDQSQTY